MDRRKVALLICAGLAVILQVIARHYYGSQMHQAFLTLMTLRSGGGCRLGVCCNVEER
jgi:hypothetical protein